MLQSIVFTEDWRCFKADDKFFFLPGVNLLVGDQGCGKSSLMAAIRNCGMDLKPGDRAYNPDKKVAKVYTDGASQCMAFDFEHDNFRTKGWFDSGTTAFHVASMWQSHGEMQNTILRGLLELENGVAFLDEPDMALSIRSACKLVETFNTVAEKGNQIIAAVHNPIVIEAFPMVLSLEHGEWVASEDFIRNHKGLNDES